MDDVFPVKSSKDEGFVAYQLKITDEDLEEIIAEYLWQHAACDFDASDLVNKRPTNIWLSAKCRRSLDPDAPEEE